MATSFTGTWTAEPFREGTPQDCQRLREMLARNAYTGPDLCDRLDIRSIVDLKQLHEGRELLRHVADPQAMLLRLFFDSEPVAWSVVRSVLSADDLAILESFGLIGSMPGDDASCAATVLLYPIEDLYVVSDRPPGRDTSAPMRKDVVYPAISKNTQHFMSAFPRTPCKDFLDLCSGTGVAALVAARHFARHATAIDVTDRATRFARFNARLNGIENATVMQGDLYEPVRGRTFDRIVAHPPYVPATEHTYTFRDGGEDGEEITRRIIAGLPEFLRPGGRFYCVCVATDRKGAPLEARIREMLGDAASEFDVAVVQAGICEPARYYFEKARAGQGSFGSLDDTVKRFERLGIEALVDGVIIVQRRVGVRPVFTARRLRGSRQPVGAAADADAFEWLLRWEELAMDPLLQDRLLDAAPRINPAMQLRQLYTPADSDWELQRTWVDVFQPFSLEAACPYWVATMLGAADGQRTGREHLADLKAKGMAPEGTTETEFAGMLVQFMGAAMFDIVGCPLPVGDDADGDK